MRVVIDPGHGAPDPGARGRMSNEADINLDVAVDEDPFKHGNSRTVDKDRPEANTPRQSQPRPLRPPGTANRRLTRSSPSIATECFVPRPTGLRFTRLRDKITEKLATAIFDRPGVRRSLSQRKRTDYRDNDPDKEANYKVLRRNKLPSGPIKSRALSPTRKRSGF